MDCRETCLQNKRGPARALGDGVGVRRLVTASRIWAFAVEADQESAQAAPIPRRQIIDPFAAAGGTQSQLAFEQTRRFKPFAVLQLWFRIDEGMQAAHQTVADLLLRRLAHLIDGRLQIRARVSCRQIDPRCNLALKLESDPFGQGYR